MMQTAPVKSEFGATSTCFVYFFTSIEIYKFVNVSLTFLHLLKFTNLLREVGIYVCWHPFIKLFQIILLCWPGCQKKSDEGVTRLIPAALWPL